ncbi:hypothetical protein [Parerythrobacter aestuarii]|uniref:hypothetical protein n=1 Tax=Parerythrobacter aestuarii TaxID=3020909 RepID=UPI0024DEE348|nr:hypothetical protein [Parerythrobacter aestuarii]
MFTTVVAMLLLGSAQPDAVAEKPEVEAQPQVEERTESAKICRYIREDMNSRRKKKVCLTKEQWQDANQGN